MRKDCIFALLESRKPLKRHPAMNQTAILIVEDEAVVAADLANQVERIGYTVAGIASHAREAVVMASLLRPRLVLMDVQLKGPSDGIDAAEAIRGQCRLPVIYLTAHSDKATLARAKLSGPSGYLVKPFDERDLAIQIELALYKHQAEMQLHESEARYRQLFQKSPAVLLLLDPQRATIVDANPAACTYYGYSHDEITGLGLSAISAMVPNRHNLEIQAALLGRCNHFISKHRLADGQTRDVEVYCGPVKIDGRELLYSIIHDVTDHKRAENDLKQLNATLEQKVAERTRLAETRAGQLQALALELLYTEERERQRIANLLHDDLQQILASARMQLEVACGGPAGETDLDGIVKSLTDALKISRNLSHELSSDIIQHIKLDAALEQLARRMMDRFGLRVQIDIEAIPPLKSKLLKVFVLRSTRELLFNVVKHAGETSARIRLGQSNGHLTVIVSDHGCGFDPGNLKTGSPESGMGLLGLQQRARYLGGDLLIESVPSKGSLFKLMVPVEKGIAS